jgi:hypothetical protein
MNNLSFSSFLYENQICGLRSFWKTHSKMDHENNGGSANAKRRHDNVLVALGNVLMMKRLRTMLVEACSCLCGKK